jgi:Ca2+-binding EF-hand superfamily protein
MRALLRIAGLAAALAAGAVPAPAAEEDEEEDGLAALAKSFDDLDADKDARLSPEELPAPEMFGFLDADKDGFVTKKEIEEAGAALGKRPAPRKGGGKKGPGDGGRARGPDETFQDWAKRRVASDPRFNPEVRARQALFMFDRDPKDGKVERKEYPGGQGDRVFRRLDRDGSGALDPRELLELAREEIADLQKQRKRPDRYNFLVLYDLEEDGRVTAEEYAFLRGPERRFRQFDRDGDGVVTYDELYYEETKREGRREEPSASRSVWDLHDKDGDGRVSAEELGAGEAVFRRLDRNRDGYLTAADA